MTIVKKRYDKAGGEKQEKTFIFIDPCELRCVKTLKDYDELLGRLENLFNLNDRILTTHKPVCIKIGFNWVTLSLSELYLGRLVVLAQQNYRENIENEDLHTVLDEILSQNMYYMPVA